MLLLLEALALLELPDAVAVEALTEVEIGVLAPVLLRVVAGELLLGIIEVAAVDVPLVTADVVGRAVVLLLLLALLVGAVLLADVLAVLLEGIMLLLVVLLAVLLLVVEDVFVLLLVDVVLVVVLVLLVVEVVDVVVEVLPVVVGTPGKSRNKTLDPDTNLDRRTVSQDTYIRKEESISSYPSLYRTCTGVPTCYRHRPLLRSASCFY